jgi:glycine/D-amino acid oxidase-like deaminating enzyme
MSADAHTAGGNFWQRSREPRTVHPPVAGDISVGVAIIGGGYTGLATAYHLKTAVPSLDVAVLDAETAGFGASGRNAGFVMTLFGASSGLMKSLHGKDKLLAAHRYMESAIGALEAMVKEHKIIAISSARASSRSRPRRLMKNASKTRSSSSSRSARKDSSGSMRRKLPSACARLPSWGLLGDPLRIAQPGEVGGRAAPPGGCARDHAV